MAPIVDMSWPMAAFLVVLAVLYVMALLLAEEDS